MYLLISRILKMHCARFFFLRRSPLGMPFNRARNKKRGHSRLFTATWRCLSFPCCFLDGLEERAEEEFDQAALAGLDLHRDRHAGRKVHLPAFHLDR